ncbi:hypothetical protein LIER_01748 [Lithospermum erythrorhizon]|uniref:Uncharacterized protein n=1 Tax=Lithospermum erythrorhizon TaxID=34254 RepID=A0AAV3NPI7_LITER
MPQCRRRASRLTGDFWRRHKRKVYVSLGIFGSGYLLYKIHHWHRRRLSDLETELAHERENDELIRARMQEHFQNIQMIADSTTLPHVMEYLSSRVEDELDIALIMEKLMRGKDKPNSLTATEKLELWNQLKILSFTRMVLSLWSMTLLSLYIRVQANILGRHLYINTARVLGDSNLLEEADVIGRKDEQLFLASADFLSNFGVHNLRCSIEAAASEILIGKQLKDVVILSTLYDIIVQILDAFMSSGSPHQWLSYLMPVNATELKLTEPTTSGNADLLRATKFEQLMSETREVLSSAEFGSVVHISVKTAIGESNLMSGLPLAKVLPRIAQMGKLLLEEPNRNRYIHVIHNIPEVEVFFTLLYSSTSNC